MTICNLWVSEVGHVNSLSPLPPEPYWTARVTQRNLLRITEYCFDNTLARPLHGSFLFWFQPPYGVVIWIRPLFLVITGLVSVVVAILGTQ